MLKLTAESLFAHRGLHDAERPRNSMPAFVAAAAAGYGIELDIHLSADGVPIVSHDPDTLHDTGVMLRVEETTAQALLALEFSGTREHLVSLDEVLAAIPTRVPLLVEIKPTRRIAQVVDAVAVRLAGREETAAVQSFHPGIVRASRRRHPQFAAGQLAALATPEDPWYVRANQRTHATNVVVRPDFLALEVPMLQRSIAQWWRGPLLAWTVTSPTDARACRESGAGLIFEGFTP